LDRVSPWGGNLFIRGLVIMITENMRARPLEHSVMELLKELEDVNRNYGDLTFREMFGRI
jgi:hypothetical protein